MNAVYDTLVDLAPLSDPEVLDGYQRYAALVGSILTPAQLATYADTIRRHRAVRIFEELTPDELAALTPEEREIALAIVANESATMENRRVAALLHYHGEDAAAPDMGHHLGE